MSLPGAILAGMGTRPGVADFPLVLPGGRAAFLELKRAKGRLSPAQLEFRSACLTAGAVYEVARSTDEAIEVLRSWGAVPISGSVQAA